MSIPMMDLPNDNSSQRHLKEDTDSNHDYIHHGEKKLKSRKRYLIAVGVLAGIVIIALTVALAVVASENSSSDSLSDGDETAQDVSGGAGAAHNRHCTDEKSDAFCVAAESLAFTHSNSGLVTVVDLKTGNAVFSEDLGADDLRLTPAFYDNSIVAASASTGLVKIIHMQLQDDTENSQGNEDYILTGGTESDFSVSGNSPYTVVPLRKYPLVGVFFDGKNVGAPNSENAAAVFIQRDFEADTDSIIFRDDFETGVHGYALPMRPNSDGSQWFIYTTPVEPVPGYLPNDLVIKDSNGNTIMDLDDENDPTKHCSTIHGYGFDHSRYFFGCDAEHGGFLMVTHNTSDATVTSQVIEYHDDGRVADFVTGNHLNFFVARHFATTNADDDGGFHGGSDAGQTEQLLRVPLSPTDDTAFNRADAFTVSHGADGTSCYTAFDKAYGVPFLVLQTPRGELQVLDASNWSMKWSTFLVENGSATGCAEQPSVLAGHNVIYVVDAANAKVTMLDFATGEELRTVTLNFNGSSTIEEPIYLHARFRG
eukprot:Clim_evm3s157 gene=Clim_evmTU3s157